MAEVLIETGTISIEYMANDLITLPIERQNVSNNQVAILCIQNTSDIETSVIKECPLYAVRRQAVLRAMEYFRVPTNIRDKARTLSRTAWGSVIKEDEVEAIIKTIPEIEYFDGKYILRKK